MEEVKILMDFGPPNSTPTAGDRRSNKIAMAMQASAQNRVTEKPKQLGVKMDC
jgi:hypothetical protein